MLLYIAPFINLLFVIFACEFEPEHLKFPGQSDLIGSLPDVNFTLNYHHYSGYLSSLNDTNLFYWFFESQSEHAYNDPIVLWLSGGPGCSSLFGALGEVAPIRMHPNGTLSPNPLAWNQKANLLFLESPAGTGFSYRLNATYYQTDDEETVQVNFVALQSFFSKFPHLVTNRFYITGQSYASLYISFLATELINRKFPPNFRGIAIGNGRLNKTLDYMTTNYFLREYHGISNFSWEESSNFTRKFWCYNVKRECEVVTPFSYQYLYVPETRNISQIPTQPLEPCTSVEAVRQYLNRDEVLEALHVNVNASDSWRICAFIKNDYFNFTKSEDSLVPVLQNLTEKNIKVILYSGDADTVCNYYAAKLFVEQLKFKRTATEQLLLDNGKTFGSIEKYEKNFMFVRFFEAGHMVPIDAPQAALKVLNEWLLNN